ncbi:MAG TPA: ferredoxin [Eggerthellaceae bacterium]|nr:ferredoxin [Eggerthellaceae bacterium]
MITVTIDGRECTCEKGEYIYDVARRNGVFIPALCRHDAFADHRACCRICIVEVEQRGRTKVVTSCVYPIDGECEIRTNSERIREERAVLLALLGHRAPDAELIGQMSSLYDMGGFERLVKVDNEKCILCGLCVQACDSLGTGAISTVNRGTDKKVDTPYDKPSEFCVGCLSCANVCPTGAIAYTQDNASRTIWNRAFELVRCSECGEVMGTPESIRHAVGADGDMPSVCNSCRKKELADEMMQTYRYV